MEILAKEILLTGPKPPVRNSIQLMAQKVHVLIVDEVKSSGNFSLSVDSTPDLSYSDQLSVVLRYLKDGEPTELFLTFLEMKSHTVEEIKSDVAVLT